MGPTLGCGGLAICQDGKLSLSRNFASSKVLDNGPIRSTFELTYEPWTVGAIKVSETKRISLDLGSNLNRIESRMVSESPSLPLATGIINRNGGAIAYDLGGSWLAYEEPANAENGTLHCAIVMSQATVPTVTDSHLLLTFSLAPKDSLIYYTGASWDKSDQFENFGDWQQYVANFAQRIRKPIEIKISKIE